jgi:hypothetical protein
MDSYSNENENEKIVFWVPAVFPVSSNFLDFF